MFGSIEPKPFKSLNKNTPPVQGLNPKAAESYPGQE